MDEMFVTPLGEQSLDRAARWWLPAMLEWIARHPGEDYLPNGYRASQVLLALATSEGTRH